MQQSRFQNTYFIFQHEFTFKMKSVLYYYYFFIAIIELI